MREKDWKLAGVLDTEQNKAVCAAIYNAVCFAVEPLTSEHFLAFVTGRSFVGFLEADQALVVAMGKHLVACGVLHFHARPDGQPKVLHYLSASVAARPARPSLLEDHRNALIAVLRAQAPQALTQAEWFAEVPGMKTHKAHAAWSLVKDGTIDQMGTGRRGNPFRYQLRVVESADASPGL